MNFLWKFFTPPIFDTEEANTKARFLNGFTWVTIVLLVIAIAVIGEPGLLSRTVIVLFGILISFVFALALLKFRFLTASGIVVVVLTWLAVTAQIFLAGGVRDVIIMAYLGVALIASMVINIWAAIIVILSSLASIWTAALMETSGRFVPSLDIAINNARDLSILFVIITALIYYATNSLRTSLAKTRELTSELTATNRELTELHTELEARVKLRTTELAELATRHEQRAKQLQAVTEVARAAISIRDINELLPSVSQFISERFGFYHVGIFLVDELNERVVLTATNSEGGQRMLRRQHQLRIEPSSIVGYVATNQQPRIALDVGKDATFFNNPDLPETRSEMAIPMAIGTRLIGVVDVQSIETNAFAQEDIRILSTLVDQITVAIENTRLFEETRKALAQSESVHQRYLGQAWKQYANYVQLSGYTFDGKKSQPLQPGSTNEGSESQDNAIAIPLVVSGQSIGILNIRPNDVNRQWTDDERNTLNGLAQRAALTLENARLLEDAQRFAARERTISDLSSKIVSGTKIDTILQTAVQELGRQIRNAEISLEINPTQD